MYCSNRKKFCCCKKTMKNIKIVLRVLTLSQTPANLKSLTNLNSQVSRCLIVKDWQNLLRLVILIWLTKNKKILLIKKKKKKKKNIRKVPTGVYGKVYALAARQRNKSDS